MLNQHITRTRLAVTSLLAILATWSCGKPQSITAALTTPTPEIPVLPVTLQSGTPLSPTQKLILESLDQKQAPSSKLLFGAFGEKLTSESKLNKRAATAAWNDLKKNLASLGLTQEPHALK